VAKWDLKGLKALVQANGNLAAFQQTSELVNTISWEMDAFKYHKFYSLRLMIKNLNAILMRFV
jgi:hypothetical protein